MKHNPIPVEVLAKISEHRPNLRPAIGRYAAMIQRGAPAGELSCQAKRIADVYLQGETRLTALETWWLSFCVHGARGEGYGRSAE